MPRLSGSTITFVVVTVLSFLYYMATGAMPGTGNIGAVIFNLIPALMMGGIAWVIAKAIGAVTRRARRGSTST